MAFGISVALCRRVLAEGLRVIFQKGRSLAQQRVFTDCRTGLGIAVSSALQGEAQVL